MSETQELKARHERVMGYLRGRCMQLRPFWHAVYSRCEKAMRKKRGIKLSYDELLVLSIFAWRGAEETKKEEEDDNGREDRGCTGSASEGST